MVTAFLQPKCFTVKNADDYEDLLETNYVISDFNRRQDLIRNQIVALNAGVRIDEKLLREVTGLVEWPVSHLANFDPNFLQVPKEALVSAMMSHQKAFPVFDGDKMLPCFYFCQ